jgi:hypothetical protein
LFETSGGAAIRHELLGVGLVSEGHLEREAVLAALAAGRVDEWLRRRQRSDQAVWESDWEIYGPQIDELMARLAASL